MTTRADNLLTPQEGSSVNVRDSNCELCQQQNTDELQGEGEGQCHHQGEDYSDKMLSKTTFC